MKQVQFTDCSPLALTSAWKRRQMVQDSYRDCLELVFPQDTDYGVLYQIFSTPSALKQIEILQDGQLAGVHTEYEIPYSLAVKQETVPTGDGTGEQSYTMILARLTPMEKQQREQAAEIALLREQLQVAQNSTVPHSSGEEAN